MSYSREEFVQGLRDVADYYESHPDLETPWEGARFSAFCYSPESFSDQVKAIGAGNKEVDDYYARVEHHFAGGHVIAVVSPRDTVCTRRVVGEEDIEVEIPDPEAPTVTVTQKKEIVEWDCPPSFIMKGNKS